MTELNKTSKQINKLSKKIDNLSKEKDKLKEKMRKKKRAEKLKQVKANKAKRKKRAVHLFILGTLLRSAELDHIDEETLIGYCMTFKKINPLKLDQYKIIGKQILAEKQIERDKKREEFKKNFRENTGQERSFTNKEYSRMIKIGAVFEMTEIDSVELAVLIGFILDFKNKNNIDKNNFYLDGKLFKIKKEEKKKSCNTKKKII